MKKRHSLAPNFSPRARPCGLPAVTFEEFVGGSSYPKTVTLLALMSAACQPLPTTVSPLDRLEFRQTSPGPYSPSLAPLAGSNIAPGFDPIGMPPILGTPPCNP